MGYHVMEIIGGILAYGLLMLVIGTVITIIKELFESK